MTLDQIGCCFRLTRERVRQIKEIALNKIEASQISRSTAAVRGQLITVRELGASPHWRSELSFRYASCSMTATTSERQGRRCRGPEKTSPFLPFKGWKWSADISYRPPRRISSHAVDHQPRLCVKEQRVDAPRRSLLRRHRSVFRRSAGGTGRRLRLNSTARYRVPSPRCNRGSVFH